MSYSDKELAGAVRNARTDLQAKHQRQINAGTKQSWQSAEELALLDATIARLDFLAGLTQLQQQFLSLVQCIAPTAPALVGDNPSPLVRVPEPEPIAEPAPGEQAAPVVYLSGDQKEEILRLLAHPTITKPERTQMQMKLNRFSEGRAAVAIAKLVQAITERSGGAEVAKNDHPAFVGDDYQATYDELNQLLNDSTVTAEERRKVRLSLESCNTQALHLLHKTWRGRIDERRGASYHMTGEAFQVGPARDHHTA